MSAEMTIEASGIKLRASFPRQKPRATGKHPILDYCVKHRLSLDQFAAKVALSLSTVLALDDGKRMPRKDELSKIAYSLGLNRRDVVTWFYGPDCEPIEAPDKPSPRRRKAAKRR